MSVIEEVQRIRHAAEEELNRFREEFNAAGISWEGPEIVVWNGSQIDYSAELKVEFNRSNDLIDIFEFFVCEAGAMTISANEVREWIRNNLHNIGEHPRPE